MYARVGVTFDEYSGESRVSTSETGSDPLVAHVLQALRDKGLLVRGKSNNGEAPWIVDLQAYDLGVAVLQRSDETALYLTRDIAEAIRRYNDFYATSGRRRLVKMLYVVGKEQELHFRQLFKILELLGHTWACDVCQHVAFGRISGMSTRKGSVVFLRDILDEARDTMLRVMEDKVVTDAQRTAEKIGLSCVSVQGTSHDASHE